MRGVDQRAGEERGAQRGEMETHDGERAGQTRGND